MSSKNKLFADDGWAVWVDGDDTSTVYLNEWLNPKGNSYVDFAVKIVGMNEAGSLNIYFPFFVNSEEIDDVSLRLKDDRLSRAVFSSMCVIDYMKNSCTSEIAYNGKTVDIVHISKLSYSMKDITGGTVLTLDFTALKPFLDNDEAYFYFRVPHKTLDEIFRTHAKVGNVFKRARVVVTTPFISERYGYSVRINEARLLPDEINHIGAFHRQKLKKAVVCISVANGYELNDSGCYRIRRLEEDLYADFLPDGYKADNAITYQWQQTREESFKGHFNFYFNISRDAISSVSVLFYMLVVIVLNAFGGMLWDVMKAVIELIKRW